MIKEMTEYDFFGNEKLTDEEMNWFHSIVNRCKAATSCTVQIIAYNHDLYNGKHKEALGCCITDNPENPLQGDTIITIDTWFIHEKWLKESEQIPTLEPKTLIDVIAHEIAHLYQWRHCKRHKRITDEIIKKINDYKAA